MDKALINPHVLCWGRQRANLTQADLAQKISVSSASRVRSWETGEAQPTFNQARDIARVLSIPFGYLFLREIPKQTHSIPDLRTIGRRTYQPSLELVDVYRDAQSKQAWLREYRQDEQVEPLAFVGKFALTDSPEAVALSISDALQIPEARAVSKTWEEFFACLITNAESIGITVLRSSTVGANTHRPLRVEEFRGFAISDKLAPFVFINTRDAKSAQIFTLLHELAHIWLAETGVSFPDIELEQQDHEGENSEAFCDKVAAEALVPHKEFLMGWDQRSSLAKNCEELSKRFRVSQIVVARRSHDLGFSQSEEFRAYVEEQMRLIHARKKREQALKKGGPSYLTMVKQRNSTSLTKIVVALASSGGILYRDAASLLGVKPKVIDQLAAEMI